MSSNETALVPVASCFGGLAVYRADRLGSCTYSANDMEDPHVNLHACLAARGFRLHLLPELWLPAPEISVSETEAPYSQHPPAAPPPETPWATARRGRRRGAP